jgi:hypothetical protein
MLAAKNMYFWSDEKYVLLVRRKICTFGPTKNMCFWSDEKYVLLVRRKICTKLVDVCKETWAVIQDESSDVNTNDEAVRCKTGVRRQFSFQSTKQLLNQEQQTKREVETHFPLVLAAACGLW